MSNKLIEFSGTSTLKSDISSRLQLHFKGIFITSSSYDSMLIEILKSMLIFHLDFDGVTVHLKNSLSLDFKLRS
jgi:hypothetical protein